jgi:hypothetical protein
MNKNTALLLVFSLLLQYVIPISSVSAALTNAEMRFYRLATSTALNTTTAKLLVKFTPSTVATENEVRVTFDAGYTVNGTPANVLVSTTSLPTECTAVPTIGSAANAVSSQAVDFTSGDLTVSTTYCFFITGGITSPASANSYTNTIALLSGSNVVSDSSDVTVAHITNDQVVISAVVPSTFTFALGANTTSFTADLSTASIQSTTGVTGSVTTNAASGWTAFLRSANAGLDSAVASDSIDTQGSIDNAPTTLSNGSEYYQLDVDETSDGETNGAVDAEYDGTTSQGGTFNGTDLEAIAAGTGATSGYVFTMIGRATIAGTTKAANDYTDTWTVVASGNF